MSNLPAIEFDNLFETDAFGKKLWSYLLGADVYEKLKPRFTRMGELGAKATPFSDIADKQGPRLITHDKTGERVDRIEYHPAYLELQKCPTAKESSPLSTSRNFFGVP